jgi:glycerol-3-phosphate dehydrogenase
MAEDTVDRAAELGGLVARPCVTKTLRIHGFHEGTAHTDPLSVYGSDATPIREIARTDASLARPLDAELPYTGAQVVWAAREEMARTLEDVLARRCRALFLNARAAVRMAPAAASLLARELGRDAAWEQSQIDRFKTLAAGYMV